tara:strand:- start:2287 stop:3057 length:771 start_codon:yes stop_codon:yes gene_type:complete
MNRVCSYCSEGGHNRRGCKLKKSDSAESEQLATLYRGRVAKAFAAQGLAVGALMEVPYWSQNTYNSNDIVTGKMIHLIESIDWPRIDHRLGGPNFGAVYMNDWKLNSLQVPKGVIKTRLVSWDFDRDMKELEEHDYWLVTQLKTMRAAEINVMHLLNKDITPSIFEIPTDVMDCVVDTPIVYVDHLRRTMPVEEAEKHKVKVISPAKAGEVKLPTGLSDDFRYRTYLELQGGTDPRVVRYNEPAVEETITKLKEAI